MSRVTVAKIALAAGGVAIFFWAVRIDSQRLRWVGIACVAAAWLLRFVGRGVRRAPDPDTSDQGPSM
jgi:hypothetical protein